MPFKMNSKLKKVTPNALALSCKRVTTKNALSKGCPKECKKPNSGNIVSQTNHV